MELPDAWLEVAADCGWSPPRLLWSPPGRAGLFDTW